MASPRENFANDARRRSILTVYQASPLSYQDYSGKEKKLDGIDLESEEYALREELAKFDIDVVCRFATSKLLGDFLSQGHQYLHFSCHGHPRFLFIETEYGGSQLLGVDDNLKAWIKAGGNNLNFVFVSACHSRKAGETFVGAGVEHVVCCEKNEHLLHNTAAIVFSRGFYSKLANGLTIQKSFDLAVHDVINSHELRDAGLDPNKEADKFALLPKGTNHDIILPFDRIPRNQSMLNLTRSLSRSELVPVPPQIFIDRRMDIYRILKAMFAGKSKARLVRLTGPTGIGKVSTAKFLAQYMDKRHMWGDLFWLPITNGHGKDGADIISNWDNLFQLFQNDQCPASDMKTLDAYKDNVHSILHKLHNRRATLFINTTKLSIKGVTKCGMFLDDLFESKNQVKVIVIHREGAQVLSEHDTGFIVTEKEFSLPPLDFSSTVALFGKNCDHVTNYPAFYKMVLTNRCELTFRYMGSGIPANTILAAKNIELSKYKLLLERKGILIENDFPEGMDPKAMFRLLGQRGASSRRTIGGYMEDFEQEEEEEKAPLRSQGQVKKRFAPLLVKEGRVYRKSVTTFLRHAVKGEKIDAVIYGKHESKYVVKDDSCWVACGRAAGEVYVLTEKNFHDSYDVNSGKTIKNSSTPQAARLRQEGFLEYKSIRKVWARKVDAQDMNFFMYGNNKDDEVSSGGEAYFRAPWDESMRVEQGDYLVMQYPDRSASEGIYRIESSVFGFSYEEDTDDRKQWAKYALAAGGVALSALLAVKVRR